jgi:DNA-binding MarR family transcriptional regulator
MPPADPIDHILSQWATERPELDASGFAVVGRILVLAKTLERRVDKALEPFQLALWGFDVLATLRRQGKPYRLTPTELSRATMLTTGAMTNRLDRLEDAGWIRREPDPADRRGLLVALTTEGRRLVDAALEARFDEANEAVSGLTSRERAELARLLGKWISALRKEADA